VLELGWVFGQVWYCDDGWWDEAKAVDKGDGGGRLCGARVGLMRACNGRSSLLSRV
jgi:hypothetical protein